jgi:hypothetical protein
MCEFRQSIVHGPRTIKYNSRLAPDPWKCTPTLRRKKIFKKMEFALAVWGASHYWVGWQGPVRAGHGGACNVPKCPKMSHQKGGVWVWPAGLSHEVTPFDPV